jgi:protein-disulfide isomerase
VRLFRSWMRAALLLGLSFAFVGQGSTQTANPTSATKKKSEGKSATPNTASAKPRGTAAASLPSKEEVDSFFRHMFGYEPAATWRILTIEPALAPGVAHVAAIFGNNNTVTNLYITPDGKNAIVGDLIPFGPDPYAGTRSELTKAKGASRGNPAAPVTIVEFSDLQCPYCKSAQPVIDKLLAEKQNAKLVFQPFPLPMHPWAMKAASYGECVRQQSPAAFWKFIQAVYDTQESINEANADEKLKTIAGAAGANGGQAGVCSGKPETLARIQQSIELGKSVGVGGTPTVFINGRKIAAIKDAPFDILKAMVDYEASQATQKK